jgi:spore maturation protein CgeB
MKQNVKNALLSFRLGRRGYGRIQESWFEWTYRKRRERYEALVAGDPGAHSGEASVARARARLARRGYTPPRREMGDIHTFAYVPSNWSHQNQIASALTALGPCTRFDYVARGVSLRSLRSREPGHAQRRAEVLSAMLTELREAHRRRPVDWFFSYAVGWDMTSDTLTRIQEELGIPTVNVSLDDKNWWDEIERGDEASALRPVLPRYDLGWTSARVVLPWYWAEGGQAIFLPEGANVDWFRPIEEPQAEVVGFVGDKFGYRPEIVDTLRQAGIAVEVHGVGWPGGRLSDEAMLKFFNRCRINLGLGDMSYSRWLTNLKGRDFEVPATGRGLYLTTYNSDLAQCFDVGREIQCYRGIDELVELVRYHLGNPEETNAMAARAREHCTRSHQWKHRYVSVLQALGILSAQFES